jgi:hypothetical protein
MLALWHLTVVIGMLAGNSLPFVIQDTHEWVRTDANKPQWMCGLLCGPLVMGYGMRELPVWVKSVVVGGLVWGLFLPSGFFTIENTVAAMWICSYIVNGKVMPEMMYLLFPMSYLMFILFSFVCALALYDYDVTRSMLFDIFLALGAFTCGLAVWMIGGTPAADHTMWVSSFEFIILPVIFIIVVSVVYCQRLHDSRGIRLEIGGPPHL